MTLTIKLIVVSGNQVAQRSCKGRNIFDNNLPSYGAIDFRISMRHEIPETPDVLPCHRRACILNSIRKVNCVLSNPIYRIHHGVVRKLTFKRAIIAKRFPCHCEVFDTLPDDVCIVDYSKHDIHVAISWQHKATPHLALYDHRIAGASATEGRSRYRAARQGDARAPLVYHPGPQT